MSQSAKETAAFGSIDVFNNSKVGMVVAAQLDGELEHRYMVAIDLYLRERVDREILFSTST